MAAPAAADSSFNNHTKRPRTEGEANSQHAASGELRTKPCTKFYSMAGCQYGEGCHFLHHMPSGGYTPVHTPPYAAHYNSPSYSPANGRPVSYSPASPFPSKPSYGSPVGYKTKLCTLYNTPEGCKFGAKCHFAHGEAELADRGGASYSPNGHMGRQPNWGSPAGSRGGSDFQNGGRNLSWPAGVSASGNRIIIPASLVGAVIGKAGANVKQVARVTGTRVSVKDMDGDPEIRTVELEGNDQQVDSAMQMLQQILQQRDPSSTTPRGPGNLGAHNFKTKMCEKFIQGSCTFGDRCHFAHGASDLRDPAAR